MKIYQDFFLCCKCKIGLAFCFLDIEVQLICIIISLKFSINLIFFSFQQCYYNSLKRPNLNLVNGEEKIKRVIL